MMCILPKIDTTDMMLDKMKNKKNTKMFFFLRHNNDIDHIVPVIYKWVNTKKTPTEVIITSRRKHLNDFRIKFIQKFDNVKIFYIDDLLDKISLTRLFNLLYTKYSGKLDRLFRKYKTIQRLSDKFFKKIAESIFKNVDAAVLTFDWTDTYFAEYMVKYAKKREFISVSLPHGDAPYVNDMETNEQFINLDVFWNGHQIFDMFDYVVVPNKWCLKRYSRYLNEKKIKMLGSARYSDEWMSILSDIKKQHTVNLGDKKIKIVLFLRNIYYPIFWDELARTILVISKFSNLFLIIKHHPRGKNMMHKFKKVNKLPNVIHVFEGISSDALMNWADIIMDTGTSTIWEAIKTGKPVLSLEFLHSNYSTSAYYIKNSEIRYRDQLYHFLKRVNDKGIKELDNFYNEDERRRFIEEVIDVPDRNVLERYVEFLEECLNESIKE